jgi:hypothetical protein
VSAEGFAPEIQRRQGGCHHFYSTLLEVLAGKEKKENASRLTRMD